MHCWMVVVGINNAVSGSATRRHAAASSMSIVYAALHFTRPQEWHRIIYKVNHNT